MHNGLSQPLSSHSLETDESARTPLAASAASYNTLARNVYRTILRLAPGKIRDLTVDVTDENVILHGRCGSFYCKQKAQHAVMALDTGRRVDNRIVVDP